MRFPLVLGELEQRQRAIDVDLVRGDRRELGACREQRGQVKDQIDFELGQDALEQRRIGDRSGELARDKGTQLGIERRDVTVTIERPAWARRPISPCPISPPAPVTRVTGVRIGKF